MFTITTSDGIARAPSKEVLNADEIRRRDKVAKCFATEQVAREILLFLGTPAEIVKTRLCCRMWNNHVNDMRKDILLEILTLKENPCVPRNYFQILPLTRSYVEVRKIFLQRFFDSPDSKERFIGFTRDRHLRIKVVSDRGEEVLDKDKVWESFLAFCNEDSEKEAWARKKAIRYAFSAARYPADLLNHHDMAIIALRKGCGLSALPIALQLNREMLLTAVQHGELALTAVPVALIDRALCLAAVKQYGHALHFVPDELRDYAVCLAAVQQNGSVLYDVPVALRDYAMCLTAVQKYAWALQHVPVECRDRAMCLAAVQQDAYALQLVPAALKTHEICWAAVQKNGYALQFVPDELKDKEMCLAAVKQDGYAVHFVPVELRSYAMFLAVVKQLVYPAVIYARYLITPPE